MRKQLSPFCLLLILLLAAFGLPAQQRDVFLLKYTPSTFFNPDRSQLLLNAEFRPNRYLGIEVSWGIPAPYIDQLLQSTVKTAQQLQVFRTEVRYYPWPEDPFYFSAEGYYIHERYTRSSGSYFNLERDFLSYSSAQIQRTIWGAGLKLGRVVRLNDVLRFEIYTGAGIRERNISVVAENPLERTPPRLIFGPRLTEGRAVLPQLLFGFRIGFAFRTRTSAPVAPTTNNIPAVPPGRPHPYNTSAGRW